MRGVALASGSNGNAIWVETPDVRLLFDAGASGRHLATRAGTRGVDLARVEALVLSHGHADHVSGAGVVARRYGVTVHASRGTWRRVDGRCGAIAARASFRPGEPIRFGKTTVHTVPTPHDFPESAAFVVEHGGRRLGVLTDLGHLFPRLVEEVATLDAAFLESNYDPELLATGPYPWSLQDRIAGPGGHLSNAECAGLLAQAAGGRLRTVVLSHLSGNCNTPALVRAAAAPLRARGVAVHVAPRDAASPWIDLR